MNQINRIGHDFADNSLNDIHNKGMLVYRTALIDAENCAGLCLIRCISKIALIGRSHPHLAEDTPAVFCFNETISASDTVVQSPSAWLDVSFNPKIGASKLLTVLARPHVSGMPNRAHRIDIKGKTEALREDGSIRVEMTNISQKRQKLGPASFTFGSVDVVRIPSCASQLYDYNYVK